MHACSTAHDSAAASTIFQFYYVEILLWNVADVSRLHFISISRGQNGSAEKHVYKQCITVGKTFQMELRKTKHGLYEEMSFPRTGKI
jgi:hypothetical protein